MNAEKFNCGRFARTALTLACASARAELTLISPAGGEQWHVGSSHRIIWSSGVPGEVRLDYSVDGGRAWRPIAEGALVEHVPGLAVSQRTARQFLWNIPDAVSATCRVRVSLTGRPEVSATCHADFAIAPAPDIPEYHWTCVTPEAPFAPRDGAGILSFRGRLWLLGGWNPRDKANFPKICNNEVWSSTNGRDWELVKPNTFMNSVYDPRKDWEGRHTAGYAVFQDRMWIIGGDPNQGHYHPDVWSSDDGREWRCMAPEVPWGRRCLHHTVAHDGKLWVLGGQTLPAIAPAELVHYHDVWNSSDGVTWTRVLGEAPWAPRGMIGGAAVFQGRIWLLGGGIYGYTPGQQERLYYNDVWSSADGRNWKRHVEFAPWPARSYHEVAVFDGRLWVLEGANQHLGRNRNDVWHSPDGVNWYELPGTPWPPRHAASVCVHAGALWVVAGNNMQSDVWKLERLARILHEPPVP